MQIIVRNIIALALLGTVVAYHMPTSARSEPSPALMMAARMMVQDVNQEAPPAQMRHQSVTQTAVFQPFGNLKIRPVGQRFAGIHNKQTGIEALPEDLNFIGLNPEITQKLAQLNALASEFMQ